MDKLKHFFQQSWLLIVASFCFGLLIAVANAAWEDNILQNEEDKFNNLVVEMLPDAETSEIREEVELQSGKGRKKITYVREALSADGKRVGWAFVCEGSGFADKIKLVLAVDADFEKLKGYGVLSSNETPGFGDKIKDSFYREQFVDAPTTELVLTKLGNAGEKDSKIVAITGATVSSEAVVEIVNKFLGEIKKHMQEEGRIGNGE
ncbi:MAG: FMN-binding protein [Phycisphaerales bacterium]|nr:MAG: FMN-binding protein [Phycisphaerales bacterium]